MKKYSKALKHDACGSVVRATKGAFVFPILVQSAFQTAFNCTRQEDRFYTQ